MLSRSTLRTGAGRGVLVVLVLLCLHASAYAGDGILRNGIGARAMGLGGAVVASPDGPLDSMAINPAGLTLLTGPTLDLGITAVTAHGSFTNRANRDGDLSGDPGFIPDGAFGVRVGPVTLGLAVTTVSGLVADWDYIDTPGGAGGTSYGRQEHRSKIFVLRTAAGAAYQITSNLSIGASAGMMYNENALKAPYIFQTQPALKGLKTLLDLETRGFGWNASAGLLYRPIQTVQLGLSYTSPTRIDTFGEASGDVGAQLTTLGLGALRHDFHYDAEVHTHLPQVVAAGVAWDITPRWRLNLQVDWVDWSDSFDTLPIKLTNGNNADLNGIVGSDTIKETPPLRWQDRFVYRAGIEYAVLDNLTLRLGYAYGRSPVPDQTLTPLTAVITEHTVAAGAGYRWNRFRVDLGYQYDIPASRRVGTSALLSGEYSNSRTEVGIHSVGLTGSYRF
jgi:long-chain fatty acid transport protein